jgi:3-hydroxyisobutyrate dehydrogenase
MKVGYVGLGSLGGVLARQILKHQPLVVWDLNELSVAALAKEGAKAAANAAALARECDIVFLCLPRSSDVEQLTFGNDGLAQGLGQGKLVVDQTSGVPSETRLIAKRLAERGCMMIDAAVSGSPQVAATGGATLMASGPEDVVACALPLLQAIAKTVYRCGARVGDGQAMKMVNNAMNATNRLGTLELVAMGRKAGLSLRAMSEALNSGSSANLTTERMLPALLEGRESTNFALQLMLKDVNQAVMLGLDVGVPTPVASTVRSLLQVGVNTLGPNARLENVVGLIESQADTRLGRNDASSVKGDGLDGETMAVIAGAVLATSLASTYEGVSIGLKYGLALTDMNDVINKSSGWSAASRKLLPTLIAGAPDLPRTGRLRAQAEAAARLAVAVGAPVMLLNAVRSVLETADNREEDASFARFYEMASKVRFA